MTPRERGQKIATLRKARGWSKRQLARAADLSPQHVVNIEAGTDPSVSILLKVAKALDIPVARLLEASEPGVDAREEIARSLKEIAAMLKRIEHKLQ